MQTLLLDDANSIVFEERFSPDKYEYRVQAGCSVDSINISATPTDPAYPVSERTIPLKAGENTDTLESNGVKYVLKVYKSIDTLAIHKKFGTLTFVNNPNNNGIDKAFDNAEYTYQWYKDGTPIPNENGQYYILRDTGVHYYTVSVTSLNGWLISTCPSSGVLPQPQLHSSSINVYPNPVTAGGTLNIEAKNTDSAPLTVEVYDLGGTLVRSAITDFYAPETAAPQQAGSYVVKVRQGEQLLGSKIIIYTNETNVVHSLANGYGSVLG